MHLACQKRKSRRVEKEELIFVISRSRDHRIVVYIHFTVYRLVRYDSVLYVYDVLLVYRANLRIT